jgi:hypothetical protein
LGRPAVVPPAGRGMWVGCAPLSGRWGEGGALSPKAPREVWPARRSSPTGGVPGLGVAGSEIGALPWGRWVRWGWTERTRSLPGGGPGLGVAGSEIQPYLEDAG